MMLTILRLLYLILTTRRLRSEPALENLALRQQLAILNRRQWRPKLRKLDRFFWLLLSRSWERQQCEHNHYPSTGQANKTFDVISRIISTVGHGGVLREESQHADQ